MRRGDDFRVQSELLGINSWPSHGCTFCGYGVGYIFKDGKVFYDAGCSCVPYNDIQERSWDDVASRYNMQTSPDVIKQMDEFWGFETIK